MTEKMQNMPNSIDVTLIAYPGAQQSALLGMQDMFDLATRFAGDGLGFALRISEYLPEPGEADLVILPPALGLGGEIAAKDDFRAGMQALHDEGVLIASVCAGALLLADCGLLDDRPATTHWGLAEAFRGRFPKVQLDPARLIVDDGDIVTAGGLMAWADLVLHLVGRLQSPGLKSALAHHCLVDPAGREQSHYARFTPRYDHGNRRILKVQHWLAAHLAEPVTVKTMAEVAGMSPRSLARHFSIETGLPPGEYLQRLRLARAQDRLEISTEPVSEVAWSVGYEDVTAFRRMFQTHIGLTPGSYRRRFHAGNQLAEQVETSAS